MYNILIIYYMKHFVESGGLGVFPMLWIEIISL